MPVPRSKSVKSDEIRGAPAPMAANVAEQHAGATVHKLEAVNPTPIRGSVSRWDSKSGEAAVGYGMG